MVIDLNSLYRLKRNDIKPAAEITTRAFMDNPGIASYFPDEEERKRILPNMFRYSIRRGVLYGEVYATSPNLEGIAVWIYSENMDKTSGLSILQKMGNKNLSKLMPFIGYLSSIHKKYAPFKHWYLLGLAVNPECQGKGYASTLLRAMFNRIDREHLPCYLETQNEKNLPIYQHHGFKIVYKSIVPDTEVINWAMLRETV